MSLDELHKRISNQISGELKGYLNNRMTQTYHKAVDELIEKIENLRLEVREIKNGNIQGDFEIEDGALILRSKNGTRFKIRPDENGNLSDVEKL